MFQASTAKSLLRKNPQQLCNAGWRSISSESFAFYPSAGKNNSSRVSKGIKSTNVNDSFAFYPSTRLSMSKRSISSDSFAFYPAAGKGNSTKAMKTTVVSDSFAFYPSNGVDRTKLIKPASIEMPSQKLSASTGSTPRLAPFKERLAASRAAKEQELEVSNLDSTMITENYATVMELLKATQKSVSATH